MKTPSSKILHRLAHEKNPVTRWVLREIIGRRVDGGIR